jgi:hypothetical protein
MNFYGKVLSDALPVPEIFAFLRKALTAVTVREPFRGPRKLAQFKLEYSNNVSGDINGFYGVEIITLKGDPIYEIRYHGGKIA